MDNTSDPAALQTFSGCTFPSQEAVVKLQLQGSEYLDFIDKWMDHLARNFNTFSEATVFFQALEYRKEQHKLWGAKLRIVEYKAIARESAGTIKWCECRLETEDIDERLMGEICANERFEFESLRNELHENLPYSILQDISNEWVGFGQSTKEEGEENGLKRKHTTEGANDGSPAKIRREQSPEPGIKCKGNTKAEWEIANLEAFLNFTKSRAKFLQTKVTEKDALIKEKKVQTVELLKKNKRMTDYISSLKKRSTDQIAALEQQSNDTIQQKDDKIECLELTMSELNNLTQLQERRLTEAKSKIDAHELALDMAKQKELRFEERKDSEKQDLLEQISFQQLRKEEAELRIISLEEEKAALKTQLEQVVETRSGRCSAENNEALKAAEDFKIEKNDAVQLATNLKADNAIRRREIVIIKKNLTSKIDILENETEELEKQNLALTHQIEENEKDKIKKLDEINDLTRTLNLRDTELAACTFRAESAEKTRDELEREVLEWNTRLGNKEKDLNKWKHRAKIAEAKLPDAAKAARDAEIRERDQETISINLQAKIDAMNAQKDELAKWLNNWPTGAEPREPDEVVGHSHGSPTARANRRQTTQTQASNDDEGGAEPEGREADNEDDPGAFSRPGSHWVRGHFRKDPPSKRNSGHENQ